MRDDGVDPAVVARFARDLSALLGRSDGGEENSRVGVALSGGPDSAALLILAAAALPGRVAAMTVDHGLRPEATEEARIAAALCAARGIDHETTRVTVSGNVQAGARDARYRALAEWASRAALVAVLTAHHADDQAETVLMRLARGAGVAGLAGIRSERPLGDARLLRPLLTWRKSELEAVCAACGVVPARDPSNTNARYDRTLVRDALATQRWLDPRRVAATASHLADAEAALEWTIDRLADEIVAEEDGVSIADGYPVEIVRRLLLRAFSDRFGASPDGPALARAMAAGADETVTVADILCTREPGRFRLRRAPVRHPSRARS